MLRSPYVLRRLPALASDLAATLPLSDGEDSYLYWSKERYGAGKSVISVSHVRISRPGLPGTPRVVMSSQQVFASHYATAGFGLTAVLCPAEGTCYLAYVNRTQVDVLGGVFGGLKRAVMEQRIRADAPRVLTEMRDRIQTGPPR